MCTDSVGQSGGPWVPYQLSLRLWLPLQPSETFRWESTRKINCHSSLRQVLAFINTWANSTRHWRRTSSRGFWQNLLCVTRWSMENTQITHRVSAHHPKSLERCAPVLSPWRRAATGLHLERKGKLARMHLQFKPVLPAASVPTIIQVRKLDGYEALFGKDTAPCLSLTHNRSSKPQLTD